MQYIALHASVLLALCLTLVDRRVVVVVGLCIVCTKAASIVYHMYI